MRFEWASNRGELAGNFVFLSASVPDPMRNPTYLAGPVEEGLMLAEIDKRVDTAVRELMAQVLGDGGRIVHGGHPKIFPALLHQAGQWKLRETEEPPVRIYQSEFFRNATAPPGRAELEKTGLATIRWTSTDLNAVRNEFGISDQDIADWLPAQAPGPIGDIHRALLAMRLQMLIETQPTSCICLGGMEGIEAEANLYLNLAAQGKIPAAEQVHVIGSTYGAAAKLEGQRFNRLDRPDLQSPPAHFGVAGAASELMEFAPAGDRPRIEPIRRTRKETVYEDMKKRVSYDGVVRLFVETIKKRKR